jgi:predicted PurR-regulated permease PerM
MQAPRNIIELLKIPWVRIALEASGIVAAVWVLHALSAVLTPVLVGLVLAYMVDPLVTWVAKRGIPRSWAVGAVFGGGALLLAGVLALGTPLAWNEGQRIYRVGFVGDSYIDVNKDGQWQADEILTRDLNGNRRYDASQYQVLKRWLEQRGWLQHGGGDEPESAAPLSGLDPQRLVNEWTSQLTAADGRTLFSKLLAFFSSVGYWLLLVVLIPVYGYFFSLHLQAVSQRVAAHIPLRQRDRTLRILSEINAVVGAFFRGRLVICGILGILSMIGFGIAGVPSFIFLGLVMGLATAIPLASGLVLVPVAMLLYLADGHSYQFWIAGITYLVVQVLEPVLIAGIMGKGVEMHPVLIVVAIFAFGALLGGAGVILAVPLAATARILFREFLYPHVRRLAGLDEPQSLLGNGSDPTAGA